MTDLLPAAGAISPLRQRVIDEMTLRRFASETQRNYVWHVGRLASLPTPPAPAPPGGRIWQRFQVSSRRLAFRCRR